MARRKKKSFTPLVRGSWQAIAEERGRFYLFIFLFIIAYSLDLLVPWAVGYTLGVFVTLGATEEAFYKGLFGIGLFALFRIGNTVFHHLARWVQNRVAYVGRINIMSKVFDTLVDFPLSWHVKHHSGENLSRLHRSAGAIESMVGTFVWQIIEGLVKVIFAGVAIFALDYWVAVSVITMSVATILAMILFNKRLTVRIRRNNMFNDKLSRICVDSLSNVVTLKTLHLEAPAKLRLRSQKEEGRILSQAIAAFMELKWGTTGIGYAVVISASLVIYFANHGRSGGAMDIAQVYVLLNYLDRIFQAIGSFTGYYSGIIEAATAYEDAASIFEEAERTMPKSSPVPLLPEWKVLRIRNLNFSYIEGEQVGLNNVSLDLGRGEKIALVGPSGSGKSTLLKAFGRLIIPDTGEIETDTQDGLSFYDLAPSCLLLPQEPEVFSETFEYNLTMGENFSDKEVSFFVSLCKLDTLVAKLSKGLQTSLAEKGLNLSVGERQRLALARGLIRAKGREIVLLDEPTSSLDPKTEKEIFLGIMYHFSDRMIVSSCHRLNLIPLFDRIVVMANSQVLEVGTFEELLSRKRYFFKMWEDYEKNLRSGNTEVSALSNPVDMLDVELL
ncbi:MAG TPA: ABC transporter ATP-binding protein [Oligoflexia bacterium]|nr:ABC transporter ATP-binding protein [Oligoflexia bacterium]HMP49444.1 ABC transporter ATP-binding protein [Oligoflexia bacterium]